MVVLTRGLAILLCLSLVAGTAGAEEIHPRFEGLERAADASETFRLNALGVVSHEESGGFSVIVVGGKWWQGPGSTSCSRGACRCV